MILLGISGWRSRLCTIVFGLGIYLVVSALISTRKLNFPTYDPLQQFRNLPPGDSSSLVARSLNSDTETHVSTTKIHSVDSQLPALRHHHHPRNLAAAIDHVQQKRYIIHGVIGLVCQLESCCLGVNCIGVFCLGVCCLKP